MKTVTIRCEHATGDLQLHVAEENMCCIQCGLIQVLLSREQAARVRNHCDCMHANLQNEDAEGRMTMSIDPSQLDLGGESIAAWRIG
jgi:hypothetical protein